MNDGIPLPANGSGFLEERVIRIDSSLMYLITGALAGLQNVKLEQTGAATVDWARSELSLMMDDYLGLEDVRATEYFGAPDGTPLDVHNPAWQIKQGDFVIFGNMVVPAEAISVEVAYYQRPSWATDHYAQAVVGQLMGSTSVIGPAVRVNTGAPISFMAVLWNQTNVYISKLVNGTATNLEIINTPFTEGDVIKLGCLGSQYVIWRNDEVYRNFNDSSLTGGAPGIAGSGASSGNRLALWRAGYV